MAEIELIPYLVETESYKIFYPKSFHLTEDDDGIVTITSPETYSNLTFSGYKASLDIDEKVLTEFFQDSTEGYNPLSELRKNITTQRLFLERGFKKDEIHWVWFGLAEANQIILASINSEKELSEEDYNLYRFMIDEIEIYPSAFEE